jgi:integrase
VIGASSSTPVHTITKQACIKYRDTLAKKVSRARVNITLDHLGHFFRWCVKHDAYLGNVPTDGLSFEDIVVESHQPFTDDDLRALFTSQSYLKQRTAEPARYWLPLLLLYSGCRREEIAGIHRDEVQREGETWYFDVKPNDTRRLKNKSSRRRVPIHSRLISMGFLDYLKDTKRGPLFPSNGGRTTQGDEVSKWFARLIKTTIKDHESRKLALHSFRGTVISRLHAAGVKGETVRALVGHAGVDVHESVYLTVPLGVLSEAVEKLDYRGMLMRL